MAHTAEVEGTTTINDEDRDQRSTGERAEEAAKRFLVESGLGRGRTAGLLLIPRTLRILTDVNEWLDQPGIDPDRGVRTTLFFLAPQLELASATTGLLLSSRYALPAAARFDVAVGRTVLPTAMRFQFGPSIELGQVPVTVSRWGNPGLEAGSWVMKGEASRLNYLFYGKLQPGFGNQFAPYSGGQSFLVPSESLRPPAELLLTDPIKWLLGQRIYAPPPR